jgi:hypothetical protein
MIQDNRVIEAGPWDKTKIDAEKRRDKAAKARYYSQTESTAVAEELKKKPINMPAWTMAKKETIWDKLRRWME